MCKKIGLALTLLGLAFIQIARAQSVFDPYLVSGSDVIGTGRFAAMGGAFSSLGGDGSALSINPAGSAVFIQSQLDGSITSINTQNSILMQGRANSNLSIPTVNVVFANPIADSPWKTVNFGLVTNRMRTFAEDISYQRETPAGNQMVDFFLSQANGFSEQEVVDGDAGLFASAAYDTYLIDPDTNNSNSYVTRIPDVDSSDQSITFSRLGQLSDYEITVGGNYNNQLYIGANIGFSGLTVTESFLNTEEYDQGTVSTVQYFDETQRNASAFIFKLGAIYRVTPNLRVSAYYHAPRSYRTIVNYRGALDAVHTDTLGNRGFSFGPFQEYAYRIKVPQKFGIGAAYILKENLIFSLEYERTNLAESELANDTRGLGIDGFESFYREATVNISQFYRAVSTFRGGLEVRLDKLYLRGGFNVQTQPFTSDFSNVFTDQTTLTGGAGYRINNVTLDGYFSYASFNREYQPYDFGVVETNEVTQFNLGIGMTYKF